jgi:urease accessory protein
MDSKTFVGLLHFADGLLPVGSYAHSFGLESYTVAGKVHDAETLESFLCAYLRGILAPADAVAMSVARRMARNPNDYAVASVLALDRHVDAMKAAMEARDASRQMGRQVLRIASNLGEPLASDTAIRNLFDAVERGETPGHHPVAFGVVGAVLGWHECETVAAFLYSTCSGLVAAALRLMPLGQLAGQRVLWKLGPEIASLAEQAAGKELDDIWSFAPGLEIAAMNHANLDARLFRS